MSRVAFIFGFLLSIFQDAVMGGAEVYQATGAKPSDIRTVVDQFRRDIGKGGVNNAEMPGPLSNGWREITGGDLAGRSVFPAAQLDLSVKGSRWSTPASGNFLLSNSALGPDDPNRNFGNINPSYATFFQPFESERLIGADTNVSWALAFAYPGATFRLDPNVGINAVGVVFTDVDVSGNAGIMIGGGNPATFYAPAAPGDGNLSFLGIRFDDATIFNNVSIFAGNLGLSPFSADGKCLGPHLGRPGETACGPITDVAAVGLIIFAEPIPEVSAAKLIAMGALLAWVRCGLSRLMKKTPS